MLGASVCDAFENEVTYPEVREEPILVLEEKDRVLSGASELLYEVLSEFEDCWSRHLSSSSSFLMLSRACCSNFSYMTSVK